MPTFVKEFLVPAKAMLFGEYAVLQNFPAVAVTLTKHHFIIRVSLSPKGNSTVNVKSAYFPSGEFHFSLKENNNEFFANLLLPWKKYLSEFNISIEILKSFDKNLGFGSSSAIISAVSLSLYEYFFGIKNCLQDEMFWKYVRQSIAQIQGKGSGYDVGVQLAAILHAEQSLCCWSFQNKTNTSVPIIKKLNIPPEVLKQYGCFLKTHVYANTKKLLSTTINSEFIKTSGEFAKSFLQNYSVQNLQILMSSQNYNSVDELQKIITKLNGIMFKFMGAGHGDCLWVLCKKNVLLERGFCEDDVAFEF